MDFLTNIEIAQLIWLIPFILIVLYQEKFRKSFNDAIQVFFKPKLIIPIFVFAFYSSLLVYVLQHFELWNLGLWKETGFWFLGALLILLRTHQAVEQGLSFFKNILAESFSILLIPEFLIGLYRFQLISAILLVPVMTILKLGIAVGEVDEKSSKIKNVFEFIIGSIIFVILIFAGYDFIGGWEKHINTPFETFYPFVLPMILTVFSLPFFYTFAVYMAYEWIFTHLNIPYDENTIPRFIKYQVFMNCGFSLRKLNQFKENKLFKIKGMNSKDEIRKIFNEPEEKSPENLREEIFWDLVESEDRADVEARIEYPIANQDVTSGFTFRNERKVIIDDEEVPPGSTIEITGRSVEDPEKSQSPDFQAKAFDNQNNLIAEGELLGTWLMNQGLDLMEENLDKYNQLEQTLRQKYEEDVRSKYGIDEETAREISVEGAQNNYPSPEPLTIDQHLKEQNEE